MALKKALKISRLTKYVRLTLALGFLASLLFVAANVQPVSASPTNPTRPTMTAGQCKQNFFSFPTWYEYLDCNNGSIVIPKVEGSKTGAVDIFSIIPPIALAIVDILLRIAGMAAVIFVIYGGISYVVSQGEPDKVAKARGTIINALVGLTIAIFATMIVKFLGDRLGGGA